MLQTRKRRTSGVGSFAMGIGIIGMSQNQRKPFTSVYPKYPKVLTKANDHLGWFMMIYDDLWWFMMIWIDLVYPFVCQKKLYFFDLLLGFDLDTPQVFQDHEDEQDEEPEEEEAEEPTGKASWRHKTSDGWWRYSNFKHVFKNIYRYLQYNIFQSYFCCPTYIFGIFGTNLTTRLSFDGLKAPTKYQHVHKTWHWNWHWHGKNLLGRPKVVFTQSTNQESNWQSQEGNGGFMDQSNTKKRYTDEHPKVGYQIDSVINHSAIFSPFWDSRMLPCGLQLLCQRLKSKDTKISNYSYVNKKYIKNTLYSDVTLHLELPGQSYWAKGWPLWCRHVFHEDRGALSLKPIGLFSARLSGFQNSTNVEGKRICQEPLGFRAPAASSGSGCFQINVCSQAWRRMRLELRNSIHSSAPFWKQ